MLRHAIAAALTIGSTPLFATTYSLEPNYTQAVVHWDHLGFSSPSATLGQGTGTLEFDQADPTHASIKVTIPLSSLNTSVPELDEHLRSADFFDAAKFPTSTFASTKIEKGDAPNQLAVTGDLTMHGVTKPVTFAVSITRIGLNPRSNLPTIGFDATTTLKRSDFGLGKFVPQVSDAIPMHVIAQAVECKSARRVREGRRSGGKSSGREETINHRSSAPPGMCRRLLFFHPSSVRLGAGSGKTATHAHRLPHQRMAHLDHRQSRTRLRSEIARRRHDQGEFRSELRQRDGVRLSQRQDRRSR